jgi:hypothetical protein
MRILVSDQNFGDGAQLERRLAGEAGAELEVEECSSEDEVAAALARHRPDALLVQFAPIVGRSCASGSKSTTSTWPRTTRSRCFAASGP